MQGERNEEKAVVKMGPQLAEAPQAFGLLQFAFQILSFDLAAGSRRGSDASGKSRPY